MHKSGMERKQGIYKPLVFFDIVFNAIGERQNKNFKIYYAWMDDHIIAALFILLYKNIVSYFTPAFDLSYGKYQPNTLLIYEAMQDALKNGYNIWNFGGTRPSLQGVYAFKNSWGAQDYNYNYYINRYQEQNDIQNLSEEKILSEYPWFYVLPFTELKSKND